MYTFLSDWFDATVYLGTILLCNLDQLIAAAASLTLERSRLIHVDNCCFAMESLKVWIVGYTVTMVSSNLLSEPDPVSQSVERKPRIWEISSGSLVPGRVKLMTYKIDTFCFLAWHSALRGYDKDWLALCQDNVTEWDNESWCQCPDFPVW